MSPHWGAEDYVAGMAANRLRDGANQPFRNIIRSATYPWLCATQHNYGHGEKHLATVFALLMMPAFLIDQAQQRCRALFQAARAKEGRALYFWNTLRSLFLNFVLPDWETLHRAIAFGHRGPLVLYDTS